MERTDISHPNAAAAANDAAVTLANHFPAPVREAYARFTASRNPDEADIVVLAVLLDHIPDKKRRPTSQPADNVALVADLGFDSIAITELVFFLEDLFQVRITNEEILRVLTVGELRAFVREKIGVSPAPHA
jgi:acyl carrier protein